MTVDTYDALIDAIYAHKETPFFVAGDRMVEVRDLTLLCYVRCPRLGDHATNTSIRCEAQWVMGTPYRSVEAKDAFFSALADVCQIAAMIERGIGTPALR